MTRGFLTCGRLLLNMRILYWAAAAAAVGAAPAVGLITVPGTQAVIDGI